MKRICMVCQVEFKAGKGRTSKAVTCSRECSIIHSRIYNRIIQGERVRRKQEIFKKIKDKIDEVFK